MRKAHNAPRGARQARAEDGRPDDAVERIRVALVELRRLFQRKELTALWAAAAGGDPRLDYADLRLLDAVVVATDRNSGIASGPAGATVGDVAHLVGVDPSRASRHVARAVARGLVARRAAPGDARQVVLEVTAKGARLQAKGSDLTRARIALALADWTDADRAAFERLFAR
ncbi:MAG TPA: MarR family winged helix-turn-helix transcriptional regulator, partial [Kofleriaceae bacterium]|nr:MarR family winged helix-turn-helix transcriptional regulator [Kofleriaceae bacterium]